VDLNSPRMFLLSPNSVIKIQFSCPVYTSKVCVAFFFFSHALCRWDCSFQYGSLVEEVDGHTALLYHRLQLDWFPM
jgi:hypothetical protein